PRDALDELGVGGALRREGVDLRRTGAGVAGEARRHLGDVGLVDERAGLLGVADELDHAAAAGEPGAEQEPDSIAHEARGPLARRASSPRHLSWSRPAGAPSPAPAADTRTNLATPASVAAAARFAVPSPSTAPVVSGGARFVPDAVLTTTRTPCAARRRLSG